MTEDSPTPRNLQPAVEAFPELQSSPPLSYAPIEKLTPLHKAIAQMEVMGYGAKEICREVGEHPMVIHRTRNSPVYQVYLADLRKQLGDKEDFNIPEYLKSVSEETFRTMANLMRNAESENVRGSMAKELADRIHPKVVKSQHEETARIEFGDSIQNLALALADHLNINSRQLSGKSDSEVVELLESEITKQEKPDARQENSD